jgi:hypothetical protein
MSVNEIGCCGAYCRTCRAYEAPCKGCTVGYDTGKRDVAKARCAVKRCCMSRHHRTCADCPEYATCDVLGAFHGKAGYKYPQVPAGTGLRQRGRLRGICRGRRWLDRRLRQIPFEE